MNGFHVTEKNIVKEGTKFIHTPLTGTGIVSDSSMVLWSQNFVCLLYVSAH
jgi:hypothetical protein